MEPPVELFDLVAQGAELHAWNSFFELAVWMRVLKWPPVPLEQWHDTAALAAAHAYPRSLEKCGQFMGMEEDSAKNKRGKYLIQRLCKPYRGERVQDFLLLQELYSYCLQDVVAERAIRQKLRPLIPLERQAWIVDQKMNLRGIRLDSESCINAIEIIKKVEVDLNAEVHRITNGLLSSTASRAKSLDWINSQGVQMDSYNKSAIVAALEGACPPKVKRFLEIRQALSRSSTKKFQAMLDCLGQDLRAHGTMMFHAASTGRWGGKHFNPQNLPRPLEDLDVEAAIDLFKHQCASSLPGEPMEVLSSCLRGMLIAGKGRRLIVSDYSAIEARVAAWLAGHNQVLDAFRSNLEIYKLTASAMFGVDYEDVDKDQRFLGKIASLALAYQGGVRAFQKMADNYGVEIDEVTALKVRDDWRTANKPIVRLWHAIEEAAKKAIKYGAVERTCAASFQMSDGDLLCELPSGRFISFPKPRLENNKIIYQGMNNFTHKWGDIETYGGSIFQSITQAVARDLLVEALIKIENANYDCILTVHDEIVSDTKKAHGSMEEFNALMCEVPTWAKGLPVAVEGYESKRYRK